MKKKIFYISLTVFVATMILSCKDTEIDEIAYDISNLQRPVPIGNGTGDQKQLYLQTSGIWDIPANYDFNDYNRKYSLRMRFVSANMAFLWEREFGMELVDTI